MTPTTAFLSTREAARRLGVNPTTLSKAVWAGRVDEPARGPGNARLWTVEDLQKAAWVLRGKDLDSIDAEAGR